MSPLVADEPTPLDSAGMATELARLDGICAKLNLSAERQVMRQWLVTEPTDAQVLYLPLPADLVAGEGKEAKPEESGAHANWLKAFSAARARHSRHWFNQAKQMATEGDEWAAYLALWRSAREDATQVDTKRVLGPLISGLTIKGRPRAVTTVHPQFSWPAGSYSRLETTNFSITSRCDAKATLAIARKLEEFYALWTQAFYPLWAPPNVTTSRLAGRNTAWSKRHQIDVVICKDRQDYLDTLGVKESNIDVSVGYYNPEGQLSFFYPDPALDATLYHELTHQLLAEASQVKGGSQAGQTSGFWLVEAIALYMESLAQFPDHWRLGGWLAPRMQAARYRGLHDGSWIEPENLSALNLESWKTRPDIAQLYTHSAALAHYFLDQRLPAVADEPRHSGEDAQAAAGQSQLDSHDSAASKAAFFRAIVATYQGQPADKEFWEQLGSDAQRGYVHFLLVRDRHLQSAARHTLWMDHCTELVLSRSRLMPQSWQALAGFQRLQWLDLSFSNATSADLAWLTEMPQLQRLSLEGLPVDASVLKQLSQLPELKELDLSSCPVSDQQLQAITGLANLETLWLSGTEVSADSRQWILSHPKLTTVGLDKTRFTTAQADELTRELSAAKRAAR